MAKYTDEQIKAVCDEAAKVLYGNTDAQNVTFPTTAIINGMKEGLDADTIADNARAAVENLPLYNNGICAVSPLSLAQNSGCSITSI